MAPLVAGIVLVSAIAGIAERRDRSAGVAVQPPAGAAWFVRSLSNPRERREARADMLDALVLPGSVVKAVTLVTALESGVVTAETGRICQRIVTADGVRFVCAHPDLKRRLSPAEALAHSCNDFFVALAPRLSREQVNRTRLAAGLPPLSASTPLAPALVGLEGPRVSPRSLVDVLARLAGVGSDPAVVMRPASKAVLLEGLAGAASYGTAAAFRERGVAAWAKTGTAPMRGGGVAGLVVALAPAPQPTHAVVVMAPGAAGMDAAAIAADLIATAGKATVAPALSSPARAPAPAPEDRDDRIRLGRIGSDGRATVQSVEMEDYIAQVLAGEGQPSAGGGAQQALAITARTFAQANRHRHRREGFDLCDTTHCQVVKPATATTRNAALATAGRILLQGGQPASVFYSASCGGRLERASEVWPGAADLSQPGRDDADADTPPWFSEMRVGDVERALRAAGLRGGRLRSLRVVQRNSSGRVARLRAEGFSPPEISGTDFRMAVGRVGGWQLVKSTAFDVEQTGGGYRFRGRGFGHGVGLCVVGAGARSARGESADAILQFYFPTLSLGRGPMRLAEAGTGRADAPPASAVSDTRNAIPAVRDVQIALPAAEESERSMLLALVRRARDETAAATARPVPAGLRVTVHSTVESFGRATGQPWWVSGSTAAGAVDLLPMAMLRQQGQLERTVRHEVAHALLDGALASRPMWVREGAAIYYAREAAAAASGTTGSPREPGGRVTCPSDAELLRPVSAGAQRDAYARADACFTRQIAGGRRWDEVR